MSNNLALFIHLSDLHVKDASNPILGRASQIAATTFQYLPVAKAVVLIFSGDLSFSGKKKQLDLVQDLIREISQEIAKEAPAVKFYAFACPGNHDCDFELDDDTREAVLTQIRSGSGNNISDSLVKTATSVQAAFFEFRNSALMAARTFDTPLAWHGQVDIDGKRIGIRCLNVAWMSQLKEKQGALLYPISHIKPLQLSGAGELSVSVLHHPFNWFSQSTYRAFQSALRQESQIIFTGHEHVQNVGEVTDIHTSPSVFIEGGVLCDSESPEQSSFNLVSVDLDDQKYLAELYVWNGERYFTSLDPGEWGSLRQLPTKDRRRFPLNQEFASYLRDPGANFSHTSKAVLELDDVFVWPELRCLDDPAVVKKHVSGAALEDIQLLKPGAFIQGDEKAGKSTLLKVYFSNLYERGYLPLYFRTNWLTKGHAKETHRAIKFALERQYEKSCHQAWLQEPRESRVLLLDDFEQANVGAKVLSDCLVGLLKYFDAVIITARDGADAIDPLALDRIESLQKLTKYELLEFGHKKRFELVCKWAAIGGHEESTDNWMAVIDKWEKDLTTAIGRQFVPSVPMYLLTLLQSMEGGRTADLQNSAFGHYYHFLITSAFERIGIDREQWAEVFNYCANLAWFIFNSGSPRINDLTLKKFNDAYSAEFTPVSQERRLRELIDAGVLTKSDGEHKFKYPYLYYLFLGQYLGDNIANAEIVELIGGLCKELHLRDNANILLFTSHHTKSPLIHEKISEALSACFADETPFDFQRDTALLNRLVDEAPSLIYKNAQPKDARAELRGKQDDHESAESLEVDIDDEDAFLTEAAAAITRLFRGIEILGQFLKNHYGTTRNPIKEALIDSLIQASLRGLHGTTSILIQESEVIAKHVERLLDDHRSDLLPIERQAYAKRIVFNLVGMITFAFVQKTTSSIGSPYLKNNLQEVVSRGNSLAYDFVSLSYDLDLPQPIPMEILKQMNHDLEKNVFARALLRSMVLRHLHLFKVPYKDKQMLCAELDIGMTGQLALQQKIPK